MNATRDVITDLWPLYQAGEASADTRRLVEEFLEQDPEFAQIIQGNVGPSLKADDPPPLAQEPKLAALRRTKRLVRLREALFWLAIFLSAAPFTVYDTSWGSGWLIRDLPWLACALALAAAALWCLYFALRRRLSASGL
jgi:hypothetical protein